ncbi:MAG: hypothetical protein RR654_02775 [Oscillospiraceae bacterium]
MVKVDDWVFSVCIAVILTTILEFFIKEEKTFKGIKMILSLYIILTAIGQFGFNHAEFTNMQLPQYTSVAPIDTNSLIKNEASNKIKQEIENNFNDENIKADCVDVELGEKLQDVNSITLQVDKTNENNAFDIVHKLLGNEVKINIKAGSEE